MNKLIYLTTIILSIPACGGGNTDDLTEEELSQYPEQSLSEQHNEVIGKIGIMPVNCDLRPELCT